jgi:predicted nucleotidyltransferase
MAELANRAPTLAELRTRREEILRVAAAHRVTNVRVFGSVARGEADARSDVDFLVDVPATYRGFAFFGVLEDLRRELGMIVGCPVDVIGIRGPSSPDGVAMAEAIEREALPL